MQRDMIARGTSTQHAEQTHNRVLNLLTLGKIEHLSQLTPSAVNTALGLRRDEKLSKRTLAHDLRAIKMFTGWLKRDGRIREDKLADMVVKANIATSDAKRKRRPLSLDEFTRIINATENGATFYNMTGKDRAMLYRVAVNTGFRSNELRSLFPTSFTLDTDEPSIMIAAASSKRRRDDRQPITAELAAVLKPWLATRPAEQPVFTMPNRSNVVRMFRKDLQAARDAWINEAGNDEERKKREESDYLKYENGTGVADFHALRHTFVTWIVQSGASVKVAQELARHSTPVLTLGIYSHVTLHDQTKALAALPVANTSADAGESAREAMRATGTDNHTANADQKPFSDINSDRAAVLGIRLALTSTEGTETSRKQKEKNPQKTRGFTGDSQVGRAGIEPATQGFSVLCSTS